MRDRSESGARLQLPAGTVVPDAFWLIDLHAGQAFAAAVVWRGYPEVGVAMTASVNLRGDVATSEQRRLRALWLAATS
jgi:hypothetical protein